MINGAAAKTPTEYAVPPRIGTVVFECLLLIVLPNGIFSAARTNRNHYCCRLRSNSSRRSSRWSCRRRGGLTTKSRRIANARIGRNRVRYTVSIGNNSVSIGLGLVRAANLSCKEESLRGNFAGNEKGAIGSKVECAGNRCENKNKWKVSSHVTSTPAPNLILIVV